MDEVLPPNQLDEALQARQAAKHARNVVVARLSARGRHNLGAMDVRCTYCHAYHWLDERKKGSAVGTPKFGSCCREGKVEIALPKRPPPLLWQLFTNNHPLSANFFQNIRQFNSALAFVSMGTDRVEEQPPGHGPYVYKIGGSVYHRSGDLEPRPGNPPRYAQLYIYDSHVEAANHRSANSNNSACDRGLMRELTGLLHQTHRYATMYKQIWEKLQENPVENLSMVIHQYRNRDRRIYNLPTSDEVAVIVPDGTLNYQRDIAVHRRGGGMLQIDAWNPAYACLHYVLFYPNGEHGFQRHILIRDIPWVPEADRQQEESAEEIDNPDEPPQQGPRRRTTLSELQYYSYLLFPREKYNKDDPMPDADTHFSSLFRGKRLLHQLLVDVWAIIDQSRLLWFKTHQDTIRADLYRGIADALLSDNIEDAGAIGTILPSSYYGGSRQMHESYQDAMAIARHLGAPQLFITMTANPNWPEIKNELLDGQHVSDRPDLAVRVFEMKRRALLDDITKNHVLGRCTAHVHTIEFQKRGLPHMHLLVWLDKSCRITEPGDVDELISAEIPDEVESPDLFATVTTSMMHGPCGPDYPNTPCWDSEKKICTKGYWPLKPWCESTVLVQNGYPKYRRSENGRTCIKRVRGRNVVQDNRNVVPYNPYLSLRYNCHINVEICVGIKSIKYVFKYVYKGPDRASIELRRQTAGPQRAAAQPEQQRAGGQAANRNQDRPDEIKNHLDARWVSAYEALWRLFAFHLHREVPNIYRLQVHLDGQQIVIFRDGQRLQDVLENAANRDTTLTAFFKLNQHPEQATRAVANSLLYQEIPSRFTWDKGNKRWKIRGAQRQQGGGNGGQAQQVKGALGRMYFVGPNGGPRFFLRLLLTSVKGPTSYEDLRTYQGQLYPTDQAACIARGLLDDDEEWAGCLREAATFQTGYQLRRLFSVILIHCHPSDPNKLWQDFRHHTCDDLQHYLQNQPWAPVPLDEEDVYDYGLYLLQQLLEDGGKTMEDVHINPCQRNWAQLDNRNRLIQEQYELQRDQPAGEAEQLHAQLNPQQLDAFNQVYESVIQSRGDTFFLDGPAGTGKTFLYKALCYKLRAEGHFVLCVASSGIAALLLPGGRTSHSRFKIPLTVHETSTCGIAKNSDLGKLISETKLIIWDEVPMQHRFCPEAFSRTAMDVCSNPDKPFGGITVVFGGDFRQILPVIPKGKPEEIIAACLKYSQLWHGMHRLRLTQNMRLQGDPTAAQFAEWLLQIGEGAGIAEGFSGSINFPQEMLVRSRNALISTLYPDISIPGHATDDYLRGRTILAGRNDDVLLLNNKILEKFPGEVRTFYSSDKVKFEVGVDNPETADLSPEYLQSLNCSSLPLSHLTLKVNCPVMIMRNLAPAQGVCNGTRGVVTKLGQRVLEVRLLSGTDAGNTILLWSVS